MEESPARGPVRLPQLRLDELLEELQACLAAIGALDAAYEIVHGRSGTLIRSNLTGG
ncbi:hypothetical protein ACWD4L_39010 [Streptomyces sp. NPDC002596]